MEVTIRLVFLFILIAWCLNIILPFIAIVLWAVIIAVSVEPIYNMILSKMGQKSTWAAFIVVFLFLAIIVVPSYFAVNGLVSNVFRDLREFSTGRNQGSSSQ